MKNTPLKQIAFQLACACLLFLHPAKAQDIHTLWFHSLSTEQGLSGRYNWYVYPDSKGFVWISSLSGLNRFDGVHVKQYGSVRSDSTSLFGEMIYSEFFEDKTSDIWFSTPEAIHAYRRKHDHFQRFIMYENGQQIKGDYQVHFLEKDTFLWVAAEGVIYRFNIHTPKQNAIKVLETTQFRCRMETAKDGSVQRVYAFGGVKKGLDVYEIKDGKLAGNSAKSGASKSFFSDTSVEEVLPESPDRVWLMTQKYGLVSWQPLLKDAWQTCGNFAKSFGTLVPRGKDQLLILLKEKGAFLLNKNNCQFQQISCKFIEGDTSAMSSFKGAYLDANDNLWLPDQNTGLHYANLNKTKFRSIPKLPLAENNTKYAYWALTEDGRGNTWIGCSPGGVFVLDKNKKLIQRFVHRPGDPNSLPSDWVRAILKDQNNTIWVATTSGLAQFSAKTNRFQVVPTQSGATEILLTHLHLTKDGKVLVASEGEGLFEVKQVNGKAQLFSIKGASTGSFQTIFEGQNGKLYIARNSTDVCVYDFQNQQLKLLDSLPIGGLVNGFYEDEARKKLYFATSNGLVSVDSENPGKEPRVYAEEEGLFGKLVASLLPDTNHNLWMGTNKGLIFFDQKEKRFRTFSLSDGIQSLDFEVTAALKRSNNELWFGGSKGITIVPPNYVFKPITTAPRTFITGIKINDEIDQSIKCEQDGATNISQIKHLTLDYEQNTLSFEFIAIEYSDPAGNQLSYKLVNSDDKWVELGAGEPGFARYSKLRHGNYTLWLKAKNGDGIESKPEKVLQITIRPPWYLTWWFMTLAGAIFVSSLYALYKIRVARIQEKAEAQRKEAEFKQKEAEFRQRQAEDKQQMAENETAILRLQMNPHFIFNSMNSINAYILKKDIDTASDYLGRFARLMRMILDFAAKPFIPIADEIELLKLYLDTEAMRFENKFSYTFDIDESIDPDDVVLPTMILQPFVENAILHGIANKPEAGQIKIGFSKQDGSLICLVEDNGVGRKRVKEIKNGSAVHTSKALTITQERLERLKVETDSEASCEIIDLEDQNGRAEGTRVVLLLPFLD